MSWLYDAQSASPDLSGDVSALFPALLPYLDVLRTNGDALFGEKRRGWWAKCFLNSWTACWCNFTVLGSLGSVGAECEPLAGYRCMQEVRSLTDKLLGEVLELMDEDLCTGALQMDGNRLSIEEALDSLQSLHGVDHAVPGVTEEKLSSRFPCLCEEWQSLIGRAQSTHWNGYRMNDVKKLLIWRSCANLKSCGRRSSLHVIVFLAVRRPGWFENSWLTIWLIYDRRPENATMERLNRSQLPPQLASQDCSRNPMNYEHIIIPWLSQRIGFVSTVLVEGWTLKSWKNMVAFQGDAIGLQ